MRVLVTGACGLLGAHLLESLSRRHEASGADRNPWWGETPRVFFTGDLMDSRFLKDLAGRVKPEVLFHCAAMTDVDACEKDPESARAYNAGLPRTLAGLLPADCLFVYLSTDAVFGGTRPMAKEEDPPAPCNVYGRSKWEGEQAVRTACRNSLIVRTNFYGWSSGRKKTFAEWLWGRLERQEPVTLFEDFFFSPIYAVDLVERLEGLVENGHRGLFHLAGSERVSKHRFGMQMAQTGGLSAGSVRAGSVRQAGLAAQRGGDLSLDVSRFSRETGTGLPDCPQGLRRFFKDKGLSLSGRFAQ